MMDSNKSINLCGSCSHSAVCYRLHNFLAALSELKKYEKSIVYPHIRAEIPDGSKITECEFYAKEMDND